MNDVVVFFRGWAPVGRVVVVGVAMYVALVVLLRLSGSRTLSTMNAFDFIVTVALGAVFGRALTATSVALLEAVVAFVLLIALQYAVASAQRRWPRINDVVTNPPALLYFRGRFLEDAMRRSRISHDAVYAAVRKHDLGSLRDVDAVVLESSGELSVIVDIGDAGAFRGQVGQQVERHTRSPDAGP